MKKPIIALCIFLSAASIGNATNFMLMWEKYTHLPEKDQRYSFAIQKTKFGLHWGPCGPSTYTIEWMYWFDLIGDGPVYTSANLRLRKEKLSGGLDYRVPAGGQIRVDQRKRRVFIELKVEEDGALRDFEGNGSYAINEKA
jgi:hypothetical protein